MFQDSQAVFDLLHDTDKIMNLEFMVNDQEGSRNPAKWISPLNYRGCVTIHTREHPLAMNYIADDKSSILVKLDTDGPLYRCLADIERKVKHANAPFTESTNDLINYPDPGSSYSPSLKLKTAYTVWLDEGGNEITQEQALCRKGQLLSYVLTVSKLNGFRNKWYFSVMLKSAKVGKAPPSAGGGGGTSSYMELL